MRRLVVLRDAVLAFVREGRGLMASRYGRLARWKSGYDAKSRGRICSREPSIQKLRAFII